MKRVLQILMMVLALGASQFVRADSIALATGTAVAVSSTDQPCDDDGTSIAIASGTGIAVAL